MKKSDRNLSELYADIIQFEEFFSLFEKKIGGIFFWERLRFPIFQKILYPVILSEKGAEKDNLAAKMKLKLVKLNKYFKSLLNIKRNPFFTRKKDIIFLSHPRRKLLSDGKWWDIFTDPIIDELEFSSTSIEPDFLNRYLTPAKTRNLRYSTLLDTLTNLKRLVFFKRKLITEKEEIFLNRISEELFKRFGYKINVADFANGTLIRRKRINPLYKKLLKRIKPKIVIVIVSYGKENFIEVCKEMNIPVIELQHGVINKYHLGYSYEGKKAHKETFPDYFLTFGDYWSKSMNFPIKSKNIISVGYPFFENQMKEYETTKKKNQILFISQPISGGAMLSKIAAELSNLKSFNYHVVYKLHPRESYSWKNLYPWLLDCKAEVIDHKGKQLYQLFAESTIQVGINSTALFEGLGLNLKTFILNAHGHEYMEGLISSGIVQLFSDSKELKEKIEAEYKEVEVEQLFLENSIANINNAITTILEKL